MLVKARTCGDARRPVLMQLEPLGRARRPNQEKSGRCTSKAQGARTKNWGRYPTKNFTRTYLKISVA